MIPFVLVSVGWLVIALVKDKAQVRVPVAVWGIGIFFLLPVCVFITKFQPNSVITQGVCVLIFAATTAYVLAANLLSRSRIRSDRSSLFPIALITSGLGIAEMFNQEPFEPVYFASFAVILALLLFSASDMSALLTVAMLSTVAITAASLAVLLVDPSSVTTNYSSLSIAASIDGRFTGPFLHPNAMGTLAALAAPVALSRLQGSGRLIAVSILGVAVLLSDLRAAWIAFTVSCLIFWAMRRHAPIGHWYVVTLLALSGVLVLVFFARSALGQISGLRAGSISSREEIYAFFVGQLQSVLPEGLGPSGIYRMTQGVLPVPVAHAHNGWLTFFIAGGLLAGIGFTYLSVRALFGSFHQLEHGGLALPVGVIVLNLVESPGFIGSNWSLLPVGFFALAGLLNVDEARGVTNSPLSENDSVSPGQ